MNILEQQAEILGQETAIERLHEVKSELRAALPDHVSVAERDGKLSVRSSHLEQDIIHHAALRDVAFLMRGVKRGVT